MIINNNDIHSCTINLPLLYIQCISICNYEGNSMKEKSENYILCVYLHDIYFMVHESFNALRYSKYFMLCSTFH